MGYVTQPRDWKTDELESMKTLSHCLRGSPSLLYVTQPVIADQHERPPTPGLPGLARVLLRLLRLGQIAGNSPVSVGKPFRPIGAQ